MLSTRVLAGAGATAALLLSWRRFRPFPVRVAGESMLPTLRAGDRLAVTSRLQPSPGDLVVVRARGVEMVKRVTAMHGEGLTLAGDNRRASTDLVAGRSDIAGVVLARYWPRPRSFARGLRRRPLRTG